MASLTHLVVGAAAGQHLARRPAFYPMATMSLVSLCPDFDVIGFSFGIRYASQWGHRGFTHSVSFAFILGCVAWLVMWWVMRMSSRHAQQLKRAQHERDARSPIYWGVVTALVVLSHPLLDALTTGGLGVALWWPWSEARVFAPLRLIPVSPIGAGMLSARGLYVVLYEATLCIPLWLYLAWPWLRRDRGAAP